MTVELQKGQRIKFMAIDDFTGQQYEEIGDVIGNSEDIRKHDSGEYGCITKDHYLVKATPPTERKHIVHISEIISIED